MNNALTTALALGFLAVTPPAHCTDAKADLKDLAAKLSDQLHTGKTTKADLTPCLNKFEALLVEHKDEKTEDVANILLMEAMLHLQVLHDAAKATAELQRIKTGFPDTELAGRVDSMVAALNSQEATAKVQSSLAVGRVFPALQETGLDGRPLSTANEKGKVVLIDFWATWCVPCVQELPNVQNVYAEYHGRGFDIIGVSLDSDRDKLTAFLKAKQMPWPQYFDGKGWENKVSTAYGVSGIPATYLLNGKGKIIGRNLRGDALAAAVKSALAADK